MKSCPLRLSAAVVLAGALVACGRGSGSGEPATPAAPAPAALPAAATPAAAPGVGDLAPDVGARRIDGSAVRLADLRGQVVLLNLWATWCKPCREEMPALERLHGEFAAQGLAVVGASLDDEAGSAEVADFARQLGASYAIWMDAEDELAGALRPMGVPTTWLIDRAGVIRWRHVGPVRSDDATLRAAITPALAGNTVDGRR